MGNEAIPLEQRNGASEKHLNSLEIINFRAFKHLKLERLGNINLIVGKNSVGKSCLLEALRLYAERGSTQMLWQLLTARDEESAFGWSMAENEIDGAPFLHVEHLFHNAQNWEEISQEIVIGLLPPNHNRLLIKVDLLDKLQKEPEFQSASKSVQSSYGNGRIADEPGISIVFNNELQEMIPLERDDFYRLSRIRLDKFKNSAKIRNVFVGTQGVSMVELDRYWDQIKLKDTKKIVLKALQMVVPEIEDVDIFGVIERNRDKSINARVIKVRVRDRLEPISLRTFGEGLTRVFGLIVALANAGDGLLLVDEIESGLHYTLQCNLWRLIFQTARQLNVQIFATTHSWDCLDSFQKAAVEDDHEEGMLIRLQRRGDEIVPIPVTEKELTIVTREQIEIR